MLRLVGVRRQIPSHWDETSRLLVPGDRGLARTVVERTPCLRQPLRAERGYALLISIAAHAALFRDSRRLEELC